MMEDIIMSDDDIASDEQKGHGALAEAADSIDEESDPEYVPSSGSSVSTSDREMDEAGDLSGDYLGLPIEMPSWSDEDKRFSFRYNLQGILGNPHQDQRFFKPAGLPAGVLNFILDRIPKHAHTAVMKYCMLAIPKLMNERLAMLLYVLPHVVQTELAIFVTEISNLAAVAGHNMVIHIGNIFERSDVLVQWIISLAPELIQAVVNIPFDGRQLLAMISSSYVVLRDEVVEGTDKQQTEAGQKSHELELPRNMPTQLKHFLNRLEESCNMDLIDLVVVLPQNLREGFAAILGQAPPNVLDIIVRLFETIGCYDIEAEQIEDPDAEDITFDLYATLGVIDPQWQLVRFLLQLPDDVLAPFWQVERAGYQLCLHIANSDLKMDFGSGQIEATPETIVHNETYRLDVDMGDQHYSIDEVKAFLRSLRSVPLAELDEDRRECSICLNAYTEVGLDRAEPETPKQLKCGHVFGSECLLDLLGPKMNGGFEYDTCPMCRASIEGTLRAPLS